MAGLQRSVTSFRRQGSSGPVWEDKSTEGNEKVEARPSHSVGSTGIMSRSRSAGARPYSARVTVSPQRKDPPSPKLSLCRFFCGFFSKTVPVVAAHHPKSRKHK
ncbi:MAPK kinase substrate protein [Quillaja saponaria]|uniref:MAPK kinase substrate protein n=1 Tax=Quillaja saponaria TaxID=32244 RepID=A0AAD7VK55_QUISA|nr:MAPK kinase substrate protein [Quillaja saponaria]